MALFHYFNALTNTRGDSLVGYRVTVRAPSGGAIQSIYGDASGTPILATSGIADTALTDDAGNFSFFIAPGTYDLIYSTPDNVFVSATRSATLLSGQNGKDGDPGPQGPPGGSTGLVGLATNITAQQTLPAGINGVRTSGYAAPGVGLADYGVVPDTGQAPSPFVLRYGNAVLEHASPNLTAEQSGAVPGEADSGGTITVGLNYAAGRGKRFVYSNTTYNVLPRPAVTVDGNTYQYGCVLVPPHVDAHSDGATLTNAGGFNIEGALGIELSRTNLAYSPYAPGTVDFNVGADISKYAVGDDVLRRFGDVSYDTPETFNWGLVKVQAVNPTTQVVTLDEPMTRSWVQNGSGDTRNRQLERFNLSEGRVYSGVRRFVGSSGLVISYERSPIIDTIIGINSGAGALICQYVSNFHVNKLEILRQQQITGNTFGARFAEASGRINSMVVRDCAPAGLFAEAGCDISVGYFKDINTSTAYRGVIGGNGEVRMHFDQLHITGRGGQDVFVALNNSRLSATRVLVETASAPTGIPAPGVEADRVMLRFDATTELYVGSQAYWWETVIPIAPQTTTGTPPNTTTTTATQAQAYGPVGFVAKMYAVLEGGATPGDIAYAGWGRTSSYGSLSGLQTQVEFTPSLIAQGEAKIGGVVGMFGLNQGGAPNWTYRASQPFLNIQFASSAVAATGKQLRVRMLIVRNALA